MQEGWDSSVAWWVVEIVVAEAVCQSFRWEDLWRVEEARDGNQLSVQPRDPGICLSSLVCYVAEINRQAGEHGLC